ncbi:MAG TPA: hypothetical protein VHP99_00470 [Pyrinomonadaceae bacterium]|nr:hypothetical protein [Pyrinomonadaceae bacterium]
MMFSLDAVQRELWIVPQTLRGGYQCLKRRGNAIRALIDGTLADV